jgi:MFS family permease
MADESKKNYKSMFTVCAIAMNSALGSFYFGYNIAELNLQENTIMNIYKILPDEYINENKFPTDIQNKVNLYYSILTSVMPLAAGIAALSSSKIMNIFGRRKTLMLADIISIIGW